MVWWYYIALLIRAKVPAIYHLYTIWCVPAPMHLSWSLVYTKSNCFPNTVLFTLALLSIVRTIWCCVQTRDLLSRGNSQIIRSVFGIVGLIVRIEQLYQLSAVVFVRNWLSWSSAVNRISHLYPVYYHGKEFYPILVRMEPIRKIILIRGNTPILIERMAMVPKCTKITVGGSFFKRRLPPI